MAIREILKYPDKGLKLKAAAVDMSLEEAGAEVRELIEDMFETMYANGGVGLAATQVGVDMRVIVLDIPAESDDSDSDDGEKTNKRQILSLINPELTDLTGETTFEEGCLSLPDITADVKRAERLRITALDGRGKGIEMEVDGFLAIALQHEVDHLDGKLFVDRIGRIRRELLLRKYKKLRAEETSEEAGKAKKAAI